MKPKKIIGKKIKKYDNMYKRAVRLDSILKYSKLKNEYQRIRDYSDILGSQEAMKEAYEFLFTSDRVDSILKIIKKYSRDFPNFIDIGAGTGIISFEVSNYFKNCVCFEPSSRNYEDFIKKLNACSVKNVNIFNIALGSKQEEKNLFCSKDCRWNNSFNLSPDTEYETSKVNVKTLDEVVKDIDLNDNFLIKIDVEGAELEVLKGAQKTLEKNCVIVSEFWPYGFNVNKIEPFEYVEYLNSLGYEFFNLNEKIVSKEFLQKLCKKAKTTSNIYYDFLIKKQINN